MLAAEGVAESLLFNAPTTSEIEGPEAPQRGQLVHIAGGGGYGFIKPDKGDVDIFTLPPLKGFPPIGARVVYNLVLDPKNGKYRADGLQAEDAIDGQDAFSPSSCSALGFNGGEATRPEEGLLSQTTLPQVYELAASGAPGSGTLLHVAEDGRFGFIKPDAGGADILALPPPLTGFPHVGTRVTFNLILDEKNGKLKADNIQPESQQLGLDNTMFGDNSTAPASALDLASLLALSGGQGLQGLQGLGELIQGLQSLQGLTGLTQSTGLEGFQGLESIQTLINLLPGLPGLQGLTGAAEAAPTAPEHQRLFGTMRHIQGNGRFGFIKPDAGGPDVLALPPPDGFPRVGSRVTYSLMMDDKTGRPKADNVMAASNAGGVAAMASQRYGHSGTTGTASSFRSSPYSTSTGWSSEINLQQQAAALIPGESSCLGTVSKANEKFAFIKQDSGEADMFVIPPACEAFGRELPPVGARVQYRVVIDSKTGRPRADRVQPAMC